MGSLGIRRGEQARVGQGPLARGSWAARAARGLALALGLLMATSGTSGAQSFAADGGTFAQTAAPGTGVTTGPAPFAAPAPAPRGGGAPRFPGLGPSQPAPDAEGPARATSPLPPGRTQRCRWDLAGVWEGRGQQTDPTSTSYGTRLIVQQFGNYLAAQQPSDGITYFGVCTGDRVELDAYSGDTYIGVQTGTVGNNGRRIESTWVLYRPDYAAGYETLTAAGRPSR
jgi:hypothetical protein